jgi:putative transposase
MPANSHKAQALFDLWPLWRRGLLAELIVARRDMLAGQQPRKIIKADGEAFEPEIAASKERVGAQEQQMIRAQAVASVTSWISNRRNDFRDAVTRHYTPSRWGGAAKRRFSALPVERRAFIEADLALLRHELYAINKARAWLVPAGTAVMRKVDDGTKKEQLVPVSPRARHLARTIFLGIAFRHRWPRFERLAMRFDDRAGFGQDCAKAWIEPAHPGGLFAWWLHVKTKTMDAPVLLPIRGWGRDRDDGRGVGLFRPGALGKTVNVFLGNDGKQKAALTRDMTEAFTECRKSYRPLTDVLALDFSLTNLFASNHGDLLGRGFMRKIRPVAERADREARRMQRAGRRPRQSMLYCDLVRRRRALIETEVKPCPEPHGGDAPAPGSRRGEAGLPRRGGAQARRSRRPLCDRDPRGRSRLYLEDLFLLRLRRCEEPRGRNGKILLPLLRQADARGRQRCPEHRDCGDRAG